MAVSIKPKVLELYFKVQKAKLEFGSQYLLGWLWKYGDLIANCKKKLGAEFRFFVELLEIIGIGEYFSAGLLLI